MRSPLEEIEFLARSEHRLAVLEALADRPRDRDDLRTKSGASSPTIGRIVADLEERRWIEREGAVYELTPLGEFVEEHFGTLLAQMETELRLRDVWRWLPDGLLDDGFDLFLDAVVTTVSPDDPYAAENRCASFLRQTSRLRGFDAVVSSPRSFETLTQGIRAGLDAEFILTPTVTERLRSLYPGMNDVVQESDNFTLWLNEDLPRIRLMIFDDRVGIGGYDPGTGVLAGYVDSDQAALREWAVSTVDEMRERAVPAVPGQTTT